jgi:hypothetical protein
MFITYMNQRNNNTNNSNLSQWFPKSGYESNFFTTKVRRTYGWLCPCGDYESNRWFNTQRHIYKLHGSGEPIDSRTGETRAEKKTGASAIHHSSPVMFAPKVITPAKEKELSKNKIVNTQALIRTAEIEDFRITQNVPLHTILEDSYSMPFLDAQRRRVTELGYGVRIPSQSLLPSSSDDINRFGKIENPSLGSSTVPGNIDLKFSGPNKRPQDHGIHYDHSNSNVDFVDRLAPYFPAIALWKTGRDIANLFANDKI